MADNEEVKADEAVVEAPAVEAPAPKPKKKKAAGSMRDVVKALDDDAAIDLSKQIRIASHQVGGERALALEVALYFDRLTGKA